MTRASITVRLHLVMVLFISTGVHAMHQVDHRYSIRGYLLDDQEQPIVGELVTAQLAGVRSSGRTDQQGYYALYMQLYDDHIGGAIELRAGDAVGRIRMRAERGNHQSFPIHWASFVGGQLREDDLGRFQMPGWGWALIIVVAMATLLVGGVKLQNTATRRQRAAERAKAMDGHPAKKKKGRRNKGKRRR
jgi:hypothetical protein